MREVDVNQVRESVAHLCEQAAFELPEDVVQKLQVAGMQEVSPGARLIFRQILENAKIAAGKRLPLCQDCGVTLVFLEIGQEVHFCGGNLNEAVNQGVREAYTLHYLRKSIVKDPLNRHNTGDNTPALIYTEIVPGDRVRITVMLKGGGCENMSYTRMLVPADAREGVKNFVIDSVIRSGANPCPPIIVGVGLGGNFEYAALLAKKALLRDLGSTNPSPDLEILENELLSAINALGIGPQGLGGNTTALAVHILSAPCHIASLPVAVNIECHSHRHKEVII